MIIRWVGGVQKGHNIDYIIIEWYPRTDKSRKKIFGSYHASTGIFAGLSLVSYFIPPDIVPGRMGMLITLFLILINSYNSVDAPPDRGNVKQGCRKLLQSGWAIPKIILLVVKRGWPKLPFR